MGWIIEHSTNTQLQLALNVQNNFYKENIKYFECEMTWKNTNFPNSMQLMCFGFDIISMV